MTYVALAQKLSSLSALEMDMETFLLTALALQSHCVKVKAIYCPLRIQLCETEFTSLNMAHFYHTQFLNLAVIQRIFGLLVISVTPLAGWRCVLVDTGGLCVVLEQLTLLQMLPADS